MGINNGKFFDAKLSGEYYNILNAAKTLYDKDADDVRNANDDFNSNERFTGLGAGGLKKFIKYGTGKIVDDQTNLYSNIIASQKQVMQAFSDKVDKAPNARMEYDTLEKINTDFKGYYGVYEENAKAVHEIVKALNEEFGDEIEGGFPQPDSKTGRERYIHICGGEDPKAGYFKECQDKLVSFDAEMKGYLNSKNIPNVYDGIKRKVKATSSILGGYNYEAPKFDGAEKLVLDGPKFKAVQAIDRDLDKFCFDIDKLVYKHKKWEPEIDPVTGFPVSSMRCSFDLLERLKDPVAQSVISSPYYNTFKKMVMETSKTHPDDKNTYMITPQDAILAFGVGGAVKSYLEHGNLSELEKNARLNYDAFKDGGVDYMVNYVAGQNAFPAAYGMTNGNESSLLVNLLNNNSSTSALPNANLVPGLLNASANASGSNSQIAALWNILGNSMGSQNAGTFLKGLYKNAGAAALMSCNATNAKNLLVTTPAPSAGAASMAVAKASTKTTNKELLEEKVDYYEINGLKTNLPIVTLDPKGKTTDNEIYIDKTKHAKIGTVSDDFVTVTETGDYDKNGNPIDAYGGDQRWLVNDPEMGKLLKERGCGVIAAVNQTLYLTGQTTLSKNDYIKHVHDYLEAKDKIEPKQERYSETRKQAIKGPVKGALPGQMTEYVISECDNNGVKVSSNWDYTDGYETDYQNMKKQLKGGVPVVWSHFDAGGELVKYYAYDESNGKYSVNKTKPLGASSHYVTATAIYEDVDDNGNLKRMVEISSWGKSYYVDYDQYKEAVGDICVNQPFSSISNTEVE